MGGRIGMYNDKFEIYITKVHWEKGVTQRKRIELRGTLSILCESLLLRWSYGVSVVILLFNTKWVYLFNTIIFVILLLFEITVQ